MAFQPEEVSSIIQQQLEKHDTTLEMESVGAILQIGDGIVRIWGLQEAMAGELLEFPGGVIGMVMNLEEDNVGAVLFGSDVGIKEGDAVKRTGRIAQVPAGEAMLGRVVNSLGHPIDGKGPIATDQFMPVEAIVPNVVQRQPVKEPLQTGLKAIDSMIPIGRGQRELIIGDRQTGKTAVCIDTMINQKNTDMYCIYVAIGQKDSTVAALVKVLEDNGAMDYSVVVAAGASEPAPLQYLAPYAGAAANPTIIAVRNPIAIQSTISTMATA